MSSLTIHSAASQNQTSLVRHLLASDSELLNAKDRDGRTPLQVASASSASLDVVQCLLDSKPELDVKDSMGWTALLIAVSAGNEPTVRELLNAGADVKAANDKGITALHYAASKGRVEIGTLLLERGADINAKDRSNQIPLHRAATTNAIGFIKLLLNPPAGPKMRLNNADRLGNTPLHLAMESANGDAAGLLIEAGADRTRPNVDGETPEEIEGVGGVEQKRTRAYIVDRFGRA